MGILQKRRKNLMCVSSLHVGNAIEEEKSSVGFDPHASISKKEN